MLTLLVILLAIATATDTLSWGMNPQNTRNIASDLNSHNAHKIKQVWMTMLCGPVLSSAMVKDGRVFIADLGGCYTCMHANNGTIIFQKNVSRDYDLPATAFVRATPTYTSHGVVLAMDGVYGKYPKSYGVWLLQVDFFTGNLIRKTLVSSFYRALLTGAPTIINNSIIVVPLSSNEETENAGNANYSCCQFAGRILAYKVSNLQLLGNLSMIPDELTGPGKYSGAAIWSSGVPVDGEYIYVTTGNLYNAPTDVQQCLIDQPTNSSCYDPRVHYDSIVEIHWPTWQITDFVRINEIDIWNVGCLLNHQLPGCPLQLGPDADFGNGAMLMIRGNKKTLVAGQKSGWLWGWEKNHSGKLVQVFGEQLGTNGFSGGFQYGCSINDKAEIFGQITGNLVSNWTLLDGTNISYGFWLKTDHKGRLQWQVPSPTHDQIKASVVTTNDIMLGATNSGLMCALADKDGQLLWSFASNKTTLAAPAINGKSVYWGTGPSATFTSSPVTPYPFFGFRID